MMAYSSSSSSIAKPYGSLFSHKPKSSPISPNLKPYLSLLRRPLTIPTLTHHTQCAANANTNTSPPPPGDYDYDYFPDALFYKVEAILRPWRIPNVSSALLKMGIRGVTVSDVRGFGAQGGLTERQAGSEFSEDNFVAKVKMEIVVSKDQVEAVLEKIISEAKTGEIGDGKIFLIPVTDVIRVRTGERGEKAERMAGGWSDMYSSTTNSWSDMSSSTTNSSPATA